jgi:hypothetical protein
MTTELTRVARIDRHELLDLPSDWTNEDRGRYLRLLLRHKGIDTNRLYRIEYYPRRRCWLLIQETEPGSPPLPTAATYHPGDASFYLQTLAEFRRAGVTAWSALAAQSSQFACWGGPYELPKEPEELTPADLTQLLRDPGEGNPSVSFDSEGGWRAGPSEN